MVEVTFDFLDAGDGFVVDVLHEGPKVPRVLGTARGVKILDRGDAALSVDALRAVAFKNPYRRFKTWAPRRSFRTALMSFGFTLIYILGGAGVLIAALFLYEDPEVVDASKFDLATIEGQDAFASEVRSSNMYESTMYIGFAVLSVGLLSSVALILFIGRFAKRHIPVLILNFGLPDEDRELGAES